MSSVLILIAAVALLVLCHKSGPVRALDRHAVEINGLKFIIEDLRRQLAEKLQIERHQLLYIPEQLLFLDLQSQQEYHLVNLVADLDPFP
ncbi:hypothetical protein J5U18_00920 [Sphingobacteriaceae bacterium WQ 2009]|uniref:Uncharacterized protein n=1 Tax=Rhinopithecimicrobium faecis TaxID=2820698 RepID=A0A8T4H5L6_9SPHI|nr:hypothetical protein [Sphingobacteriaceae bacterium WQ 2009]